MAKSKLTPEQRGAKKEHYAIWGRMVTFRNKLSEFLGVYGPYLHQTDEEELEELETKMTEYIDTHYTTETSINPLKQKWDEEKKMWVNMTPEERKVARQLYGLKR